MYAKLLSVQTPPANTLISVLVQKISTIVITNTSTSTTVKYGFNNGSDVILEEFTIGDNKTAYITLDLSLNGNLLIYSLSGNVTFTLIGDNG